MYAKEPTKPAPRMAIISPFERSVFVFKATFLANKVMDQNINMIDNELLMAETLLIQTATFIGSAKKENNRPIIINNGAPGGWPTSNLYAVVTYSPQSQRLTVSSIVIK